MNYARTFHGMRPYNNKQKMLEKGEFKNPYTGQTFCDAWRESYNRYTEEFNRSNTRAAQEFYLDQRHKFVIQCVDLQSESNQVEKYGV